MENEFIQKQHQPVSLQFICTLKIALYRDCTQSGIVLYLQDGEWVYSETVPACLSPVYLYTENSVIQGLCSVWYSIILTGWRMSLLRNSTSLSLQFICTLKIALYRDCTQSGIVLFLQDGEWVYWETVPACLSPVYLYTENSVIHGLYSVWYSIILTGWRMSLFRNSTSLSLSSLSVHCK